MIQTRRRMRICNTLLVMNLAFIWGNSLMPGSVSQAISDWVERFLWAICSEEMEAVIAGWFQSGIPGVPGGGWLRKLAHFLEFGSLGMCLAWLFGMVKKPGTLPVFCGIAAAFIDEGIQMFTPDRAPSIRDVGIDSCGVIAGIMLLQIGHVLMKKKRINQYSNSGD